MMEGLLKLINFTIDNWSVIVAFLIVISAGVIQMKKFFAKSDEEKIKIAKQQIKECIMDYIGRAEFDYEDMIQAGSIKRAQVIKEIFKEYQVLNKVIDQESVITFIDETINEGLKELRKIIAENQSSFVITTKEEE